MKIKKYFARSFNEGKVAIEADLGPDAIIMSSNTSRDANGNTIFEITAALDDSNPMKIRSMKSKITDVKNVVPAFAPQQSIPQEPKEDNSALLKEMEYIKDSLQTMSETLIYKYSGALSYELSRLYKTLRKAELKDDLALKMVNFLSRKNHNLNYQEYLEEAKKYLAKEIVIADTLKPTNKQQIVMFSGPTGCGKTMSLMKVAIVSKWVHKAKVLIISCDTFKVGGSEQLQTYASVAGLPFRIAYTAGEIKKIISSESDYDFIFIDTPGRSYKNKDYVNELGLISKTISPDFSYLVISASTSEATINEVFKAYSTSSPNGVILTKLDEVSRIGAVYSELINSKIPVAYITNGQQIPDEIEPADKTKLVETMFQGISDE
jgi:flagellar biosynthesis protein FlhF